MPPTVSSRVDAVLWPTVFDELKKMLVGYGGSILFADLAPIYAGLYPETDLRRVSYTGLSDGQNIILHEKRGKTRSAVQWAWDSLHLFGHMFQWHMNGSQATARGIKFWGASAQAMATRNFLGCSTDELLEMQTYEAEANRFSLSLFEKCLGRSWDQGADAELPALISDLQRYTASDIIFLTRYYASSGAGKHGAHLFSEDRILSRLIPVTFPSNADSRFRKVEQICVPVIH